MSPLQRLQTRYGAAIDREIRDQLSRSGPAGGFYGMMSYQLGYVNDRLEPARSKSGKRFRPLLCVLAAEGVGGSADQALCVAASLELIHNFSLIHDDIEDHDPARRHRATVWKVWGEPQAINAGDGMFAIASRLILDGCRDPVKTLELARRFQDMCILLTEGQYLDMSFEARVNVTTAEYLEMIERKTGAVIAFSLWSGAYLGGADESTCRALRTFGLELGKAFQIRDDIMGIWGSPRDTGKEAAKDLHNRKKTLPVLAGIERGSPSEVRALHDFFQGKSDDLTAVLAVLDITGARSFSEERAAAHLDLALEALGTAALRAESRGELEALARELTGQ